MIIVVLTWNLKKKALRTNNNQCDKINKQFRQKQIFFGFRSIKKIVASGRLRFSMYCVYTLFIQILLHTYTVVHQTQSDCRVEQYNLRLYRKIDCFGHYVNIMRNKW